MDLIENIDEQSDLQLEDPVTVCRISSVTGSGLDELMGVVEEKLRNISAGGEEADDGN